jgi:hypothetical protein
MATMTQVFLSILVARVFLTFFPDVIKGLNLPPAPTRGTSPPHSPTPNSSDIEAAQPIPDIPHGLPKPRDPDALPPRNVFESFFEFLYNFIASIGTGNVVFAIKAGLLTIVLCLPSLIKSSAKFAYGVWHLSTSVCRYDS